METGTHLSQVGYGFFATIVNDSFLVTDDKGRFYCWCRRRPEGSWSPLNFPAAWTTSTLVLSCVGNVFGYFRRRNGNGRSYSPDESFPSEKPGIPVG